MEEKWSVFHATVITFRPSFLCNIRNEVSLSSGLTLWLLSSFLFCLCSLQKHLPCTYLALMSSAETDWVVALTIRSSLIILWAQKVSLLFSVVGHVLIFVKIGIIGLIYNIVKTKGSPCLELLFLSSHVGTWERDILFCVSPKKEASFVMLLQISWLFLLCVNPWKWCPDISFWNTVLQFV